MVDIIPKMPLASFVVQSTNSLTLCLCYSFVDVTDKLNYPYIRTLLEFDTREFLNVLAFVSTTQHTTKDLVVFLQAFEEKELDIVDMG